jgi:hypothetical protein
MIEVLCQFIDHCIWSLPKKNATMDAEQARRVSWQHSHIRLFGYGARTKQPPSPWTVTMVDRQSPVGFLDTTEGEISFFRAIMRTRPVGIHRYFHVLSIRNAIKRDTGSLVSTDDIWDKLKTCYDLEALEDLVRRLVFLRSAKLMTV